MAPPQRRHLADPASGADRWIVFPSGLGWFALVWHKARVYALTFGHPTPRQALAALKRPDDAIGEPVLESEPRDPFARRLQAFAAGHRDDFADIPVALDGFTDFQRRVLQHCRRIPYGWTLTYAELACRAGAPRAARAVGNVMSHNRIPLVIPCHRVVGTGGSLGGFSAPDGTRMKRRLLELEGVYPLATDSAPKKTGRDEQ